MTQSHITHYGFRKTQSYEWTTPNGRDVQVTVFQVAALIRVPYMHGVWQAMRVFDKRFKVGTLDDEDLIVVQPTLEDRLTLSALTGRDDEVLVFGLVDVVTDRRISNEVLPHVVMDLLPDSTWGEIPQRGLPQHMRHLLNVDHFGCYYEVPESS